VAVECFASPLNARFERFCSAFADVDAPFGSLGSFFDFTPTEGSYEANPPFEPQTMLAAVTRAEALLSQSEALGTPLSFAFIVPSWASMPFHRQLLRSRWLRGADGHRASGDGPAAAEQTSKHAESGDQGAAVGSMPAALQLAAEGHAFVDGAQHLKECASERFRVSSFDTTVAVLQSSKGAATWPVDAQLYDDLAAAFQAALPSRAEAEARMRRGGGDAVAKLLRRRAEHDASADGAALIGEPPVATVVASKAFATSKKAKRRKLSAET